MVRLSFSGKKWPIGPSDFAFFEKDAGSEVKISLLAQQVLNLQCRFGHFFEKSTFYTLDNPFF